VKFWTPNRPSVNFINLLPVRFPYKILAPKIKKLCFGFEMLVQKILYEKLEHKMLMKLTPSPTNDLQVFIKNATRSFKM